MIVGVNWGGPATFRGIVVAGKIETPFFFTAASTPSGIVLQQAFVIPPSAAINIRIAQAGSATPPRLSFRFGRTGWSAGRPIGRTRAIGTRKRPASSFASSSASEIISAGDDTLLNARAPQPRDPLSSPQPFRLARRPPDAPPRRRANPHAKRHPR
ncbi:hypothetical protein QZM22_18725 [Burkholderia oklahomensis]|uniref:hypothetical protein n=1 Tax=Burkholderia oklahomensis TaxID=342113 RepID=UPI002656A196|nr:hypothetical protein [Burkholderia oklahomensis]MDN7674507.1 hypothetical protein [Burkholderia oklahomensis]